METKTTHWALLIGINYYEDGPLFGCVRDVELLSDHFKTASSYSSAVKVVALTATAPEDAGSAGPVEDEKSRPTYDNVMSELEHIEAKVEPGHFVYVHYSGHGTKFFSSSDWGNENTGNLALVLFDPTTGTRYLPTEELARRLNRMVQRGVFVTLVLDCCFSGSVVRAELTADTTIRMIPFDPRIYSAHTQEPKEGREGPKSASLRGANVIANLLIDDTAGYAAFAACGPHELAKELTLGSREKHGALSFFLLYALKTTQARGGQGVTNQALYRNLLAQFHASWPVQTPMIYGNKHAPFFGSSVAHSDPSLIPVFRSLKTNVVHLRAGQAHGISVGDELVIYPFQSLENGSTLGTHSDLNLKVKVDNVRALTSTITTSTPGSTLDIVRKRQVWKARLSRSARSRRIPVRLTPNVGDTAKWIAAASEKQFFEFYDNEKESPSCLFNVSLTNEGRFHILNESLQGYESIPEIPAGLGAEDMIVNILNHIAAFKVFEGILNRKVETTFAESFRLRLTGIRPGQALDHDTGIITITDGDILCIDIENLNISRTSQGKDGALFIAIFDLTPEWEIDSLLAQHGGPGFRPIPAKSALAGGQYSGKDQIRWRMTMPDAFKRRGVSHCDSVIKVFVTSRPGWFGPMLLPKITSSSAGVSLGGTRGNGIDRITGFLEKLRSPSTRATESTEEDWVAVNYIIRTTAEP
ncbi:caspase domain-containing protein [Xylaria palmicola]|nr:caspase domain-containing protein [Xylaria palmicola]